MLRTLAGVAGLGLMAAGAWGVLAGAGALPGPVGDDEAGGGAVLGAEGSPATASVPDAPRAAWREGAPRRVDIPELGVRARTVPVTTQGDTLLPPSDPRLLGWWADGAVAGASKGTALVTGHTVHEGEGALDDLGELRRGDRVVVRLRGGGAVRYRVERVREYTKGRLAEVAERIFDQESAGRLVLVTCDDWDGERYRANVVVTATPRR